METIGDTDVLNVDDAGNNEEAVGDLVDGDNEVDADSQVVSNAKQDDAEDGVPANQGTRNQLADDLGIDEDLLGMQSARTQRKTMASLDLSFGNLDIGGSGNPASGNNDGEVDWLAGLEDDLFSAPPKRKNKVKKKQISANGNTKRNAKGRFEKRNRNERDTRNRGRDKNIPGRRRVDPSRVTNSKRRDPPTQRRKPNQGSKNVSKSDQPIRSKRGAAGIKAMASRRPKANSEQRKKPQRTGNVRKRQQQQPNQKRGKRSSMIDRLGNGNRQQKNNSNNSNSSAQVPPPPQQQGPPSGQQFGNYKPRRPDGSMRKGAAPLRNRMSQQYPSMMNQQGVLDQNPSGGAPVYQVTPYPSTFYAGQQQVPPPQQQQFGAGFGMGQPLMQQPMYGGMDPGPIASGPYGMPMPMQMNLGNPPNAYTTPNYSKLPNV
eukprot:g2167.t1